MHFLFPSDPLRPLMPDPFFVEQMEALAGVGFTTSLVPDAVISEGAPLRGIPVGAQVVYRGWMLRPEAYGSLEAAIGFAGGRAFTSGEAYVAAHHLPCWYPLISEWTPETRVYPVDADLVRELRKLGWDAFFVKDYVKSLKTSVGSLIQDPALIPEVVAELQRTRGEIEGGICVRRVEDFVPDTERRYFVLCSMPYGPDTSLEIPEVVHICAKRIPSPFFSVDVALRGDGMLRVIEIGDGQVSDLVGWSPEEFANMWVQAEDAVSR